VIAKLILALILVAASVATAADRMPQPGSYGFNWLDAASHCKKLTAKDLASVSKCTASTNAFGLEVESQACRVDENVELIVYRTAAQCQESIETMQSNGP